MARASYLQWRVSLDFIIVTTILFLFRHHKAAALSLAPNSLLQRATRSASSIVGTSGTSNFKKEQPATLPIRSTFNRLSFRRFAHQQSSTSTILSAANTMSIENTKVQHAPDEWLPDWMVAERTRVLNLTSNKSKTTREGEPCVVYWMQRDVRAEDNWALLWAASLAQQQNMPLRVVYAMPPPAQQPEDDDGDDASSSTRLAPALEEMPLTARHADFLLGGLELVHKELKDDHNVPMHVVKPTSHDTVGQAVCDLVASSSSSWYADIIVSDFSPLRHARQWMELQAAPLLKSAKIDFCQVDAHNIVPVWIAGDDKRQVGARTLRPRIHRVLSKYLTKFPSLKSVLQNPKLQSQVADMPDFDRKDLLKYLQVDTSVPPVKWAKPGTKAGLKQFKFFTDHGLKEYDKLRNDPNQKNICSNLSPWINHGHVSFQRITLDSKKLNKYANGTASFIEEGVIRRELSDNYLYYTPNDYDALEAAAGWAQETLQVHATDEREHVYTLQELEEAKTRDDLWNAAQLQVVQEGQMHGFMRMYWAKKILEWTPTPLFALRAAQYFNDKYALDGRDPNGFVGVGWSIMGIHDQGWKERDVFGKIRYMNYAGCKRKFNVAQFVARYPGASENAAAAGSTTTAKVTKGTAAKKRKTATKKTPSSSRKRLAKKL